MNLGNKQRGRKLVHFWRDGSRETACGQNVSRRACTFNRDFVTCEECKLAVYYAGFPK